MNMEKNDAMNKYKGKVDNISFDVAKGARERYKKIAKEANMKLGEFVITAMEEYIRRHDLDTVETYNLKLSDADDFIYLDKDNCYFPVKHEIKEKIENGEIDGINIHESNLQISGITWSSISYSERTGQKADDSAEERISVGCPVPMINQNSNSSTPVLIEQTTNYDNLSHLLSWYSIFRKMFLYNSETNGVNYKLDHHPYRVINAIDQDNQTEKPTSKPVPTGDTQVLSPDMLNSIPTDAEDNHPLTRQELKETLPGLIDAAIRKYLDK